MAFLTFNRVEWIGLDAFRSEAILRGLFVLGRTLDWTRDKKQDED
jgi:hypothetical protein